MSINVAKLFERVAKVALRYDFDSEEIEQDIKDAVEAVRGEYALPIGWRGYLVMDLPQRNGRKS